MENYMKKHPLRSKRVKHGSEPGHGLYFVHSVQLYCSHDPVSNPIPRAILSMLVVMFIFDTLGCTSFDAPQCCTNTQWVLA